MAAERNYGPGLLLWLGTLGDLCAGRGRIPPHAHPGQTLKLDPDGLVRCRWHSLARALTHSHVQGPVS